MTAVPPESLLSARHVAAAFGVEPQTISRWARAGKLTPIKTLGGHRRYRKAEVYALLSHTTPPAEPGEAPNPHPTKKRKDNGAPDRDVITRARLNALATALTAHGLHVRIGADALTVRNPIPCGEDTSPNPGRYQAITTAPDQAGTLTWHWAWTTPGPDPRLRTRPIAPADDITTTATTIAHALGTRARGRRRTRNRAGGEKT